MKFKAHIKLTDKQKLHDRNRDLPEREFVDFEFTFYSLLFNEQLYYMNCDCHEDTMQILVPWLLAGNQPEIMMNENEIKHVCNEIELIKAKKRFKGEAD